jgi:Protein of unknown function DUF262/Protein of unknown function (DUF1524)
VISPELLSDASREEAKYMIEPTYAVLQMLFADRVFRIPSYQRFYSWRTRQRNDLFTDLEALATRGDDQHHFMATIVCHRTSETRSVGTNQYRIYDIVDGQQRMTTLIILLKCIELAMPSNSEDRTDLAKILVKRDGQLILLQTNNANEHIFNRFIREGTLPRLEDIHTHSDQNLMDAITECNEFVRKWSAKHGINNLMSLVLHRLGFVVYDTEDSRVVYTVFEVLNSRGLAVDWLDKTKSVLMGRAFELSDSPAAAEAEIGRLQSIWALVYGEIAKEDVPGEEILRVAATLYYGHECSKPRSADESLELLRSECDTFQKPRIVSECLLDVARRLVKLHGDIYLGPVTEILHARVLAVAIMSCGGASVDERSTMLDQWERITFRIFGLFGCDARKEVGEYIRLSRKIVSQNGNTDLYRKVMTDLTSIGSKYRIDEAVMEGLSRKDCYSKSPEMCRYVLWQYEEYLTNTAGAGSTINEQERIQVWRRHAGDSIEHIFPQNSSSERAWNGKMVPAAGEEEPVAMHVGRIGNLLLLPLPINQQAKIKGFQEKKALYKEHRLRMIKEVCSEADWTLESINTREAKLVEWAKTRWCDIEPMESRELARVTRPIHMPLLAPQASEDIGERVSLMGNSVRPAAPTVDSEEDTPTPTEVATHLDQGQSCVLASYEVFVGTGLSDPRSTPQNKVTASLVEIVACEGPVTVRVILDRYRVGAGLGKLRGPTRDALTNKLNIAVNSGFLVRVEEDCDDSRGDAIALPSQPPVRVRQRGPRQLEDIPVGEIAALIHKLGIINDESTTIVTELLNAYDLKRRTKDALVRLNRAIDIARGNK